MGFPRRGEMRDYKKVIFSWQQEFGFSGISEIFDFLESQGCELQLTEQ
jgi:hypothetical protein